MTTTRRWVQGVDVRVGDVIYKGVVRLDTQVGDNDVDPKYRDYAPGRVFDATYVTGPRAGQVVRLHVANLARYEVTR